MGSKKYRVSQNGTCFGHFPGKDIKEAVNKAITAGLPYHPIDIDGVFQVKCGCDIYDFKFEA